jgi:hypothetical protein
MRPVSLLLIALTASLPMAADAVDVDLGAMVEGVYDSNIYRTSSNQKQDGSFRFTPTIRIDVPGRKFSGDVYYAPTYEVFTTYSDANDLTHYLANTLNWLPSEKTTVRLFNRFEAVDVLNFANPDQPGGQPPDNDIERERLHIFGSQLSVSHLISSRWTSETLANFDLFNSEKDTTVDSRGVSAYQLVEYGLTASDRIGGGLGGTFQFFEDTPYQPKSKTFTYNIFASYARDFGERTTLTLRVGPALIHTMQDALDEGERSIYPFISVGDQNTNVAALENALGYDVKDAFGNDLPGNTPVAAESLLIPDADNCVTDPVNKSLYDERSPICARDRLLRSDAAGAEQVAWQAVAMEDMVTVSGFNNGTDDMRWTIFAEAAITHLWMPNLASTLSYNRREAPARGQGASTVADSVIFQTTWQPSELWDLSVRGSYLHQESPTNLSSTFAQIEVDDVTAPGIPLVTRTGESSVIEVSNEVATHRWGVVLRAARRITRRISGTAYLGYADQRSKHTSQSPNDFGHFLAIVGVKYDFDPFRF